MSSRVPVGVNAKRSLPAGRVCPRLGRPAVRAAGNGVRAGLAPAAAV